MLGRLPGSLQDPAEGIRQILRWLASQVVPAEGDRDFVDRSRRGTGSARLTSLRLPTAGKLRDRDGAAIGASHDNPPSDGCVYRSQIGKVTTLSGGHRTQPTQIPGLT